jgi:hypothetical protein
MLQILGKHEMLIESLQDAPKRKLMSAFHSQAQIMTCYAQRRVGVHHKAIIRGLKLEEFLQCALL